MRIRHFLRPAPEATVALSHPRRLANQIKIGLGIALVATLTGCVGYVDGGGPDVVVAGPEVGFWGGFWGGGYDRGRDVRGFSARGAISRGVAHGGGGGHGGGRH
jgi:hypothetical protein